MTPYLILWKEFGDAPNYPNRKTTIDVEIAGSDRSNVRMEKIERRFKIAKDLYFDQISLIGIFKL